jgi:hypothetical protein
MSGFSPLGTKALGQAGGKIYGLYVAAGSFTLAASNVTLTYSINRIQAVAGALTIGQPSGPGTRLYVNPGHLNTVTGAFSLYSYRATITKGIAPAVIADGFVMSDAAIGSTTTPISDVVRMKDYTSAARSVALAQALGIALATPTYAYRPGALVADVVNALADPDTSTKVKYGVVQTDVAMLTSALIVGQKINLADAVGIAQAFVIARGAIIADKIGLLGAVTPNAKYYQTLVELLGAHDNLQYFLSGVCADAVGVLAAPIPLWRPTVLAADAVAVLAALSPTLRFSITAPDGFTIGDTQLLHAIFKGTLSDTIQVSAAYVGPEGLYTSWCVNTRNSDVTEYQNWAFNCFAQMGDQYVGGNRNGLYQLSGSRDDGANILAHLKSGIIQFASSKLTGFKALYIGMLRTKSEDNFFFKLNTADGRSYTYAVKPQPETTAKITVGKGIRARYFSFELITNGMDFDLESIEFVPMVAGRRV